MTAPEPSLRLFIALQLPDAWKDGLGALQDEMRAALHERFGDTVRPRWVRPEGIHLTLKFLGATPASRVEAVETALRHAVPAPPAFTLQLANVGSFADRRSPRIILAGVYGETKALFALAERIETWLASAGWPRDKRSFHPHLTLARLPETLDDATRRAVAEVTSACQAPRVPAWPVDSVHLIRSHLGPDGSRYETLATFPA
jgi:2'-5' RNA ligase